MAFPKIRSATSTLPIDGSNPNSTNPSFTLPPTIGANDAVLFLIANDGTADLTSPTGGFSIKSKQSATQFQANVLNKVAVGDEGGTTISAQLSASESSCYIGLAIQDWSGDLNDIEVNSIATGSGVNPDPNSITASWGSDDNLYIVVNMSDNWDRTATSFPTGYNDNQLTQQHQNQFGGTQAVSLATRELAASSDDPSAFTIGGTGNDAYGTFVVVVKPSAAATPSIDSTTDPVVDQVQNSITTSNLTGTPSGSLGGESVTITGSFPNLNYTIDIADIASETTGPLMGQTVELSVTGNEGTATANVVTDPKAGWDVIRLTNPLNTSEGGIKKAIEDNSAKTVVAGNDIYYDAANNTVITTDGTITSDASTFQIQLSQGGDATTATTWTPFEIQFQTSSGEGGGLATKAINLSSLRIGL